MKKYHDLIHEDYMRSLMFGLQDGIVSTTGIVVGISIGVENKAIVILAAFVAFIKRIKEFHLTISFMDAAGQIEDHPES